MLTAWKTFTEALGLAPVSTAPWALPLVWPSRAAQGVGRLQQIDHWPLGFEDVSAQWGLPLSAQPAAVDKALGALGHGHWERDWLNALGALAVVSEFWRIHQALERYQARAASIHVQSVAMLPHDYRWDVRLHGANAQADRELSGRWAALKLKWRSGQGKVQEPARTSLAFPTAFPEVWLGEGTKLLLAPWPNPPRVAGGYELAIEADVPLADQVGAWFGSGYQKQWLQRHLDQTLDVTAAPARRPRM